MTNIKALFFTREKYVKMNFIFIIKNNKETAELTSDRHPIACPARLMPTAVPRAEDQKQATGSQPTQTGDGNTFTFNIKKIEYYKLTIPFVLINTMIIFFDSSSVLTKPKLTEITSLFIWIELHWYNNSIINHTKNI